MGRSNGSKIRCRAGAVLPVVLGILLAVTCLMTAMLNVPGGLRRVSLASLRRQQTVYDAESALLAYMAGFPADFFEGEPFFIRLPRVTRSRLGPWAKLSAATDSGKTVQVLAGVPCDSGGLLLESRDVRRTVLEGFKANLEKEILTSEGLSVKSGNRRLWGNLRSMSLRVESGDLSLDLEGNVAVANFWVDGSVTVRGNVSFDTLRIYAKGPLEFRGAVKVAWLEAYSEDRIESLRELEFSGGVVARHSIEMGKKTVLRYPSFLIPLSGNVPEMPRDSVLMPDFVAGPLKPFQWSLK